MARSFSISRFFFSRSFMMMAALILLIGMSGDAISCPTCKEALANDAAKSGFVQGYFWSILFMMSMPFLIITSLSTYFYILVRAAKKNASKESSLSPALMPARG